MPSQAEHDDTYKFNSDTNLGFVILRQSFLEKCIFKNLNIPERRKYYQIELQAGTVMGKFSFLFTLSILLLLCVSAKMVTPVISARTSITSKQDIEKDRAEKIEASDEEKNENEGKVKPGEFILTHFANINFLHGSKISYLKNNPNLPTTYSKVLQQPPKNF